MTAAKVSFLSAVLAVLAWGASPASPAAADSASNPNHAKPLVLIVSFDGFRWDYLTKTATPNFGEIISSGVKAKYIKDVFITKTFPNHFTLVTGLYEESHGVVGNAMYDPVMNETFKMNSTDPEWWSGGEPIWIANQKQGGRSSVVLWPSGNINFSGVLPDFYIPTYDSSIPFKDRVDMTIDNFLNGAANFGALYFQEPDHSGHLFGPDSPKLLPVIKMCDDTAGYLMQRLKETGLYERTNVIITSDHGMATISPSRVIVVEEFIDRSVYSFHTISNNPIMSIWPENEDEVDAIYQAFRGKSDHMTAYKKEDIPPWYHYRDNRRISPILLVADVGWQIHSNKSGVPWPTHLGTHGYNNSLMVMHPFFMARGPAFRRGYEAAPFSSTHVYSLMCHILGIRPAPNNGTWKAVSSLLRAAVTETNAHGDGGADEDSTSNNNSSGGGGGGSISKFTIFGICLAIGLVVLVVSLLAAMCLKQRTYCEKPMQYRPIADTSLEKDSHEPFLPSSRL